MVDLSRREALAAGGAAVLLTMLPFSAFADTAAAMEDVGKFTGGKTAADSADVVIDMPEIAENGNTVPVTVTVKSPMTADNYVKRVMVVADGNPRPGVATFHFSPMSGVAEAATRMRLAKTQDIIAVAELSNGSFIMHKTTVKVTIGGCGG